MHFRIAEIVLAAEPGVLLRERACLGFAEQYVLDPHGITDGDVAALRARLGTPAVAMLTLGIAVFDALARFQVALGVVPAPT